MGQVDIGGIMYDIYGTYDVDDPGPPIVPSAVTYFAGQLNTAAWDAATPDDQKKSLVTATRIFDKQLWVGTPTDTVTPQPLAWPRVGVSDCDGNPVPDTEIPEDIVFGSYELAVSILAMPELQVSSGGSNVKREKAVDKVGDLSTERETEYFVPTNIAGSASSAGRFPTNVQEYVRCFLGGDGIGNVCITGSASSFFLGRTYGYSGDGIP